MAGRINPPCKTQTEQYTKARNQPSDWRRFGICIQRATFLLFLSYAGAMATPCASSVLSSVNRTGKKFL